MERFIDGELRQLRAMNAMDALEDLLSGQSDNDSIGTERIGALVGLVFDAVREALPKAAMMLGVNDEDD